MFIGHYGPAFGAKAALRQIPLFVLFFAVQWLDVVWSVLVMTGVEKVRIVPGLMAASALDLYDIPYSHGILGAFLLSALLGGIVALFMRRNKVATFWLVALCAFSHWILDLLVHRPDLWIYGDVKIGFGLWRWLWVSLPLQTGPGGFLYHVGDNRQNGERLSASSAGDRAAIVKRLAL